MSTDRRDDGQPGDSAVDQAWRAAATDEPSARVDTAILAAARAAAAAQVKPTRAMPATRHRWTRWQPLAAAAGVAGLAFTIVQMLPRDQDVRLGPSLDAVQPERGETRALEKTDGPAEATVPAAIAESNTAARNAAPVPTRPSAPEAPARPAAAAAVESDAYATRGLDRTAQESRELLAPEAWAHRIETLHAAGDDAAAVAALREFRAAYPDADQYLAESLQGWAAGLEPADAPGSTRE